MRLTLFRRRSALLAAVLVLAASAVVTPGALGEESGSLPPIDAPLFREVGRIDLTPYDLSIEDKPYQNWPGVGSFMIINPGSRRGYEILADGNRTVIESFDLDTLRFIRRVIVPGEPLPAGYGQQSPSSTGGASGEIVHAVDTVAKRIYLPMNANGLATAPVPGLIGPDTQQIADYFLVIDEVALDHTDRAFGYFTFPAGQERLMMYPLLGLTVTHKHVPEGRPGKLLAALASPYPVHHVSATYTTVPGAYDHTLAQWDPTGVSLGEPALNAQIASSGAKVHPFTPRPVARDWDAVLVPCGTASMSSPGGRGISSTNEYLPFEVKNYQWGILSMQDAVFLGCQSSPNAGAVVRVAVDSRTGLNTTAPPQLVGLGKPIGDVLVDDGGGRLLVRSFGGGGTWWPFDTATMRFTGAIAGTVGDTNMGAGIDPSTGRLYTLTPDECAAGQTGSVVPVRGGLKITETRLDPVPAPQIVVPGLAFNSWSRILIDPVTRRVFLRRGPKGGFHFRYPNCDLNQREDPETDRFYRVYEDRIPAAVQPPALDDAVFTTNVPESAALTQASYLGAGTGYGVRSILTGGVDAVANRAPTTAGSQCGRDDREALAGSVGKVELSDQTIAAEAAALDADGRTQEALGDPVSRCRPQAPYRSTGEGEGARSTDELNRCIGGVDVREGSFDQANPGVDENKDGCPDRDRKNRYAAGCIDTGTSSAPGFDDGPPNHVAPRDGFEAVTECDGEDDRATARAVASGGSQAAAAEGAPLRVGNASSRVTVERTLGKGVTVKVDSIARGVEIPGVGTIGVVRTEAEALATGRDGGARTKFTRTICDVNIAGVVASGCLDDKSQQSLVARLNESLLGRGTVRLRTPDQAMAGGTAHGYLAGIQRDRKELFTDQAISRDRSLAVPGLEIVFYQGDSIEAGAGRQLFQLAGVQASTSYGITCMFGVRVDGKCAAEEEESLGPVGGEDGASGESIVTTVTEQLPGTVIAARAGKEGILTRILRGIPRAVAEALRLLFNNPRELGLLAALWALLYAPCYLGDRRRAVRDIAGRRLSSASAP